MRARHPIGDRSICIRRVPVGAASIQPRHPGFFGKASVFSACYADRSFGPRLALKTCAAESAVRIEEEHT